MEQAPISETRAVSVDTSLSCQIAPVFTCRARDPRGSGFTSLNFQVSIGSTGAGPYVHSSSATLETQFSFVSISFHMLTPLVA
jgi:hypothetical protein